MLQSLEGKAGLKMLTPTTTRQGLSMQVKAAENLALLVWERANVEKSVFLEERAGDSGKGHSRRRPGDTAGPEQLKEAGGRTYSL